MRIERVARRLTFVFTLITVLAGCASAPKRVIDPADRSPAGGREVAVLVSQGEIRGAVEAAKGGQAFGLVGALIDVSVNQHRANKAEAAITPLRDSLGDYNFDQHALAATSATLQNMDWLGVRKVSFSKDVSHDGLNSILDRSASPEVLLVVYDYALTPDFSGVEVSARVTIAPKAVPTGKPPSARFKLDQAMYSQNFTYVTPLANPAGDLEHNSQLWARSNARAARLALDIGLAGVNKLMQRSLQQSPGDVAKLTQGAKVSAAGMTGKLIEKDDAGTFFVDATGMWVYVAQRPVS